MYQGYDHDRGWQQGKRTSARRDTTLNPHTLSAPASANDCTQRAADREFALRRNRLVSHGEHPLEQVAALFVVLSRTNAYEGRDPTIVADSLRCGVVADYLQMSIDEFASVLIELETRGLIEPGARGTVRLKNVIALEDLADEVHSSPP